MQHLDTDRGAKAELKAANAIPVNGELSMGRLRDGRTVLLALNSPMARWHYANVRFTASICILNFPIAPGSG
jgi:hypothetical protein